MKPLVYDLYAGLGGWAEGFLAEGYRVVGFDIERHDYGTGGYPGELVLQDIRTLHGSQLCDAAVIVASSPCQEFSYRAMPWKRAKALPPPFLGIDLFWQSFRIQYEASEAAGREIPLVAENVAGAQRWVGRSRYKYGSFHLWGDLPALMPAAKHVKVSGFNFHQHEKTGKSGGSFQSAAVEGIKVPGIQLSQVGFNVAAARQIDASRKPQGFRQTVDMKRQHIGYSRKAASAQIAKIPFPLSSYLARVFKPEVIAA